MKRSTLSIVLLVGIFSIFQTAKGRQTEISYSAIFTDTNSEWDYALGLDEQTFENMVAEKSAAGFRLDRMDVYPDTLGTSITFAAIWVRDDLKWDLRTDITELNFPAYADSLKGVGYRISDLEFNESRRYFAVISVQDTVDWTWVAGKTQAEFFAELDSQPGRPSNIKIYRTLDGSSFHFAGVWVNDGARFSRKMIANSGEMGASIFGKIFQGLRLGELDSFFSEGELKYCGFYVDASGTSSTIFAGSDKTKFIADIEEQKSENLRPVLFEIGVGTIITSVPEPSQSVENFTLFQNYPNPFNPETRIAFELPKAAFVKVEVFTLLGEKVSVLAQEFFTAGLHTLTWNATSLAAPQTLPSGIYILRVKAGDFIQNRKMTLIR